jgi:hypothetical protein
MAIPADHSRSFTGKSQARVGRGLEKPRMEPKMLLKIQQLSEDPDEPVLLQSSSNLFKISELKARQNGGKGS